MHATTIDNIVAFFTRVPPTRRGHLGLYRLSLPAVFPPATSLPPLPCTCTFSTLRSLDRRWVRGADSSLCRPHLPPLPLSPFTMATLPSFLFPVSPPAAGDLAIRPPSPSKGKGRALTPLPPPPPPASTAAPFITLTGATDRAGYPVVTIHSSLLPPPGSPTDNCGAAVAAALSPVAPSTPLVVVLVTHGGGRPSAAAARTLAATLDAAGVEAPRIRSLYVLGADVAWRAAAAASSWVVGGPVRAAWATTEYVDLVEDLEAALGPGLGEAMGLTWGEVVADEEHRVWLGRQWVRSSAALDPSAPLMHTESVALTGAAAAAARPAIKTVGDYV